MLGGLALKWVLKDVEQEYFQSVFWVLEGLSMTHNYVGFVGVLLLGGSWSKVVNWYESTLVGIKMLWPSNFDSDFCRLGFRGLWRDATTPRTPLLSLQKAGWSMCHWRRPVKALLNVSFSNGLCKRWVTRGFRVFFNLLGWILLVETWIFGRGILHAQIMFSFFACFLFSLLLMLTVPCIP